MFNWFKMKNKSQEVSNQNAYACPMCGSLPVMFGIYYITFGCPNGHIAGTASTSEGKAFKNYLHIIKKTRKWSENVQSFQEKED